MIKETSLNTSDFKRIDIEVQNEGISIARNVTGRFQTPWI